MHQRHGTTSATLSAHALGHRMRRDESCSGAEGTGTVVREQNFRDSAACGTERDTVNLRRKAPLATPSVRGGHKRSEFLRRHSVSRQAAFGKGRA
jgi:hypothetical protein